MQISFVVNAEEFELNFGAGPIGNASFGDAPAHEFVGLQIRDDHLRRKMPVKPEFQFSANDGFTTRIGGPPMRQFFDIRQRLIDFAQRSVDVDFVPDFALSRERFCRSSLHGDDLICGKFSKQIETAVPAVVLAVTGFDGRKFLDTIDANLPAHALSTATTAPKKTAVIRGGGGAWPASYIHLTPNSASWINLVERWFTTLTNLAPKRRKLGPRAQEPLISLEPPVGFEPTTC